MGKRDKRTVDVTFDDHRQCEDVDNARHRLNIKADFEHGRLRVYMPVAERIKEELAYRRKTRTWVKLATAINRTRRTQCFRCRDGSQHTEAEARQLHPDDFDDNLLADVFAKPRTARRRRRAS